MSTYLVINSSSYECQTTAEKPYLRVGSNAYLPLTTQRGTNSYTQTTITTSESTYESIEESVSGYSGSTTFTSQGEEVESIEIIRSTSSTWRQSGGAYDISTTKSLQMTLDGRTGNNTISYMYLHTTADYGNQGSFSTVGNIVSKNKFDLNTSYNFKEVVISQDNNYFIGESYSSSYDDYVSSKTRTASSLIGKQTFWTKCSYISETLTGYTYQSLSTATTFVTDKVAPNVTVNTTLNITHTLTDSMTETITETFTKDNNEVRLTNSTNTYYFGTQEQTTVLSNSLFVSITFRSMGFTRSTIGNSSSSNTMTEATASLPIDNTELVTVTESGRSYSYVVGQSEYYGPGSRANEAFTLSSVDKTIVRSSNNYLFVERGSTSSTTESYSRTEGQTSYKNSYSYEQTTMVDLYTC